MVVQLHAVNFKADDKLKVFIDKRLEKLERFYGRILQAEVFLKVENTKEKTNKLTEIKLVLPKGKLLVSKIANSFEEATDRSVQALERMVKKKKQIRGF
jgi:putative sigma-54 modulation protein